MLVSGRIQTGSYTNREGQKVYTTEVILTEQEFADSKGEAGKSSTGAVESGRINMQEDEGFMHIPEGADDEGLPFN